MYKYEKEKKNLYTDEGFDMFIKIRDNVMHLLSQAGAFRLEKAISGITGNSFSMLACIDKLVEQGKIKELPLVGVSTQRKIYVKGSS